MSSTVCSVGSNGSNMHGDRRRHWGDAGEEIPMSAEALAKYAKVRRTRYETSSCAAITHEHQRGSHSVSGTYGAFS